MKAQMESFINLGARWGWVVNTMPRLVTHGNDSVPIIQQSGWALGPVWTSA